MPPEMSQSGDASEVRRNLAKPLIPQLISVRRDDDGDAYDYLHIHVVITQANLLFGHGNWSTQIREHKPLTDSNGQVIGYSCIARVSIPALNACYDGYGFNALEHRPNGKISQTAHAHDTAAKGAESDAIKRAFRYLGDRFGNSLYESSSDRAPLARLAIDLWEQRLGNRQEARKKVLVKPYQEPADVPVSFSLNRFYEAIAAPKQAVANPAETTPPPEQSEPPEPPAPNAADDYYPTYPGIDDPEDPFDPENPFS